MQIRRDDSTQLEGSRSRPDLVESYISPAWGAGAGVEGGDRCSARGNAISECRFPTHDRSERRARGFVFIYLEFDLRGGRTASREDNVWSAALSPCSDNPGTMLQRAERSGAVDCVSPHEPSPHVTLTFSSVIAARAPVTNRRRAQRDTHSILVPARALSKRHSKSHRRDGEIEKRGKLSRVLVGFAACRICATNVERSKEPPKETLASTGLDSFCRKA